MSGSTKTPATTGSAWSASEKYRTSATASTPTAPASDSGSGPRAAAATESATQEPIAAVRK